MAQLIDNYNFGFPLNTVEDLNNVEQNIVTDDKYVSTLVCIHQFRLTFKCKIRII